VSGGDAQAAPPAHGPLAGRTVVVTRPRAQAASLIAPLEALGATVLAVPTIRIVPRPFDDEVAAVVRSLDDYRLVVFTSANAVHIFAGYLERLTAGPAGSARPGGSAGGSLARTAVAAIGPATAAALGAHGVSCDLVPDDFVAEGLLEAFERRGVAPAGARVLIPRAREARSVLPDTLRARGALVDVLPVYDTVAADALAVPAERIAAADYITFTSSSTVRQFVSLMERDAGGLPAPGVGALAERLSGVRLCSIGPVTSETLRELGFAVAVEAREYTAAGVVAAISRDALGA
jgi:uroporphyrinogen III methyltransferase/synthase